MPLRAGDRADGIREIDRFEGGVGWIAHPDETMQRASHALAVGSDERRSSGSRTRSGDDADEVWVVDPVDAPGVDDLLAEFGPVAGVVVCLDRHVRDAAAVANRHDVPVYLPDWFEGVAESVDAPIVRFGRELAETGIEAHVVVRRRFWREVALYDPERGTLVVPEAVGTADYFRARGERLGVHPALRATPPRDALGSFDPGRILVGHGAGVTTDAAGALRAALGGSRRRAPALYAKTARAALPF